MIIDYIGFSSIGMAFFVTAMCMLMARRYHHTKSLGKAFIFLGLSFAFYGSAETVWYYLDEQGTEPYQNYPDIFYVGYYIFGILHVMETLRFFKTRYRTFHRWEVVAIPAVVIAVSLVFALLTYETDGWEFGLLFVIMASILGTVALFGLVRVYFTTLSFTWVLIGLSIIIASIIDIQYYAVETLAGYEYGMYPVIDLAWFGTDIIMVIAIIFHRRTI